MRGDGVYIGNRLVETEAEREARLRRLNSGLVATLKDVKKEVLGDRSKTPGNDIPVVAPELPFEREELSPREYCNKLRLQGPERYKELKCEDPKLDDK
jgi:hypothetical protein